VGQLSLVKILINLKATTNFADPRRPSPTLDDPRRPSPTLADPRQGSIFNLYTITNFLKCDRSSSETFLRFVWSADEVKKCLKVVLGTSRSFEEKNRLGRVEGRYYPAPLSVRSGRANFSASGSRCFRLSPYPCAGNRGMTRARLLDYPYASSDGCHLYGVNVSFHLA
jgi:hypothetical protein